MPSKSGNLRILGIDPGSNTTGYGVIEETGGRLSLVVYGAIRNPSGTDLPLRLAHIHEELVAVIEEHRPDEVAIESLFHAKNAKSALVLGHARGVALLAAAQRKLPIHDYAPREIKKALVGTGAADKTQVQQMVRLLLHLEQPIRSLDASDGVAIAICHAHSRRLRTLAATGLRGGK